MPKKKKWYFVTKIVLTYCEKKSLEQFIQAVKGQKNFGNRMSF